MTTATYLDNPEDMAGSSQALEKKPGHPPPVDEYDPNVTIP